jgi:hypothetical protein
MTIPWPGGPDPSVNRPDPSTQVAQGLSQMSRQIQGLNQAIAAQTQMMQRSINAQSRYQVGGGAGGGHGGGGSGGPQMNPQLVANAQAAGQTLSGPGMQQVSILGAASSSQNMQAYLAQRIGQWIAGVPLYGQQGGQGAQQGGQGTQQAPSAPQGPQQGGHPQAAPVLPTGRHAAASSGSQAGTFILQNLGAQVAASGGGPDTVMNAVRSIPGVGAAIDSASGIAKAYLTQREAGRMYQNVEGGSNLGAQTERLHAFAYEASMYGRMPGGAAAQAFGAVTQMGYNQAAANEGSQPQNRQSALNFIYHNYTATGMDVNESTQYLQTASQNATVNLQQVSDALNKLSTAAGQAGTNAETARQQFNSYFGTALGQGAGNGATGVAQGVSQMQAMMGKQMSGVNFSGELSQSSQYLLSGMSGLSAPQIQQLQRNNPAQYNQLKSSQNMQFLSEGGLMTPQMQSGLKQMITQAGGTKALTQNPDLTQQIVNQFLNKYQVSGNINENLWAQEISSLTGVTMNANQAMDWLVSQSAGINEASANPVLAQNKGASVNSLHLGGAPTGKGGLATGSKGNVLESMATLGFMGKPTSWQQSLKDANSAAASPYLAAEGKSQQRSPVLESLIQNTSSGDQVAVQTATGSRVMSVADAMKYYPQELMAGNVQFYGSNGQALGNTAALTGGLVNTGASVSGELKQKAGSTLGKTAASYLAGDKNAGATNVSIGLSSEAQQLLKLLPSNNDQAAAASTVPANTYARQASR